MYPKKKSTCTVATAFPSLLLGLCASSRATAPAVINVQLDQPGSAVAPTMHGLFFEAINYGADGGLYAESAGRDQNSLAKRPREIRALRANIAVLHPRGKEAGGRTDDEPRPECSGAREALRKVGTLATLASTILVSILAVVSNSPIILWFRQDLRLRDNAALQAALVTGRPVVPVYILDDEGEGNWPAGGASRWWLHHSLAALDVALRTRGSQLVLARGDSNAVLEKLVANAGASTVYWNRRYEPAVIKRDTLIKASLAARGIEAGSFNSALLFEPHTIANKQGGPFQVFTPYWRHCLAQPVAEAIELPARRAITVPEVWPGSLKLAELELLPGLDWADGFAEVWTPGEESAQLRLKDFLKTKAAVYDEARDIPAADATSRLAPHLHFGEIGPRQIWAAARALSKNSGIFPLNNGVQRFLTEVGWREFAHHLLYHFPNTPERPLRGQFEKFSWAGDPGGAKLRAWQRGRTGYPIVDAGMRQLWQTGWMHNRVRMIVASFLVKHLRLPWTHGAAWFWDTLVDADLASNTLGWQWSAGCGADAAPYFRIFAPVTQGEKFDASGEYVRRWVPELAKLPDKFLQRPWEAPSAVLAGAGVRLGKDYPHPVVDHAKARAAALAAFKALRGG